MSSEEEYYDIPDYHFESRSSNRARRRGSGQGTRSRKRRNGYYGQKSRRAKAWYNQNTARLIAACMLLLVLGYEVIILKEPLTNAASQRSSKHSFSKLDESGSTTQNTVKALIDEIDQAADENENENEAPKNEQTTSNSDGHPPPSSSPTSSVTRPVSSDAGETTAERIKAAMKPISDNTGTPSYTPLKQPEHSSIGVSVKKVEKGDHVPASALSLEEKPADAEEESSAKMSPKSSTASSARDIEPPKPQNHPKIREGGAEPGAGENFWRWFQETKGSEGGGVSNSISCPEENKRLCQMVYKYFRKYKIRAVFDASCGTNLDWMPAILQKAGGELWGFKYYCSATEEENMTKAKETLAQLKFVEYFPDEWWRDGFPEDTELLFAWDILPHIAYGRVWNFFVKAKKQDIKYILVDNYPGILNDPSPKRNYLNVRKHPFRFPAAKEVVQNVTEPGETAKRQLLFYESASLPENLQ